jgi:hypothetical protein
MWSPLFQSLSAEILQQLIVGYVVKPARHFCSEWLSEYNVSDKDKFGVRSGGRHHNSCDEEGFGTSKCWPASHFGYVINNSTCHLSERSGSCIYMSKTIEDALFHLC